MTVGAERLPLRCFTRGKPSSLPLSANNSRDAPAREDDDRRTLGDERRIRRTLQRRSERASIDLRAVTFKPTARGLPDAPLRMRHVVFDRASVPLRGIAPVVLGDELLDASVRRQKGLPGRPPFVLADRACEIDPARPHPRHGALPSAVKPPFVFGRFARTI